MRTLEQILSLRTYVRGIRETRKGAKLIGFVPTMGALHEGHLSLVRKAKADCDVVIASIFVNPTQFGPKEDLAAYPRNFARDQQLCMEEGVDALFAPTVDEVYPSGFQTVVTVPEIAKTLEGEIRPGHFAGVATVVLKLLNIVLPDRLYLGQKDFQQALVVDRMMQDLNHPAELSLVPTVRAADGLALSSRNSYLSADERRSATVLYRALQAAKVIVEAGEMSAGVALEAMKQEIANEPLARPDYICIVNPATLNPVERLDEATSLAVLAVRIGTTRLIDNAILIPPGSTTTRLRFMWP